MQKLQRDYTATIEIKRKNQNGEFETDKFITIEYPTTCNFHIELGAYQSAQMGVFQFYNLPRDVQADLWLDMYEIGKKRVIITFQAGYSPRDYHIVPMVFYGGFTQSCISYRDGGSTEWITELRAFEGGYLYKYGFINLTVDKYTKLEDVLNYMVSQDKDIKVGYITPQLPPIASHKTFIGQTMDLLGREYGGYEVFIDKGKLNILGTNDVLPGDLLVITDQSGLLGSPRRSNLFVELDMLFEPQLKIGQAVSLLSDSMPQFNQAYKVIAIKHNGIISPRVSGKLITTLTLSLFTDKPNELKPAKVAEYTKAGTVGQWIKPVSGIITGQFKEQRKTHLHGGLDIAADANTPIVAPANGTITMAAWFGGYGKCVQMDNGVIDGKRVTSLYGHMSNFIVKTGDTVYQGQTIGYVGSTGQSTGPHLHFEIKEDGSQINPIKYIGKF